MTTSLKPPHLPELLRHALRSDFLSFLHKSFHTLHPTKRLTMNWHMEIIADLLMGARQSEGKKRVIINLPPRYLKSFMINVAWPAWLLANHPSTRIISASYSEKLSLKHALDFRAILQAPWFKRTFPECRIRGDANQKHKLITTHHGYRFSTSVGGTLTGEGGDVIIVDDPQNACYAHSPKRRQAVIDWFEQSLMSRLDDKENGAIILVMQRLHPEDLTGHLMKKKGLWYQLTLPAIATDNMTYETQKRCFSRKKGEALHPKRESYKQLMTLKKSLGFQHFEAQYQQHPLRMESSMVRSSWIQYLKQIPTEFEGCYQSWDTAIMTGKDHDYSVCTSWGVTASGYVLLDVYRKKVDFHDLKQDMIRLYQQWKPHSVLLEGSPQGHVIWQELYRTTKMPILRIPAKLDKITRFTAILSLFESGRIWLPKDAPWLDTFLEELLLFPTATHDDQVDSVSQFLNYHKAKGEGPRSARL